MNRPLKMVAVILATLDLLRASLGTAQDFILKTDDGSEKSSSPHPAVSSS